MKSFQNKTLEETYLELTAGEPVKAQLRSELVKHSTTRTEVSLLLAMVGLVILAVLLHGFALPGEYLDTRSEQLTTAVGWGEQLGVLFAALLGAMSITNEIRYGTIRPTFLVTPQGSTVLAAKSGLGCYMARASD